MKKRYLTLAVLMLFGIIPLYSQDTGHNWQRMSGIWEVKNSTAVETQGRAVAWSYYELLNLNTILSLQPLNSYTSIDSVITITDRIESPAELILSFNITSESKNWFYHMYAFKLSGGYWGINKAAFLYSDRADKSKPFNTKNNTFIKELASTDCKIKYNKTYKYRIAFEGTNVVLYINDEKILSAPFPEKSHDGRIAISSKNAKISIDRVEVKHDENLIFEDDFNENSIYVKILKVQKVPANDDNNTEKKKP